MYNLLYLLNDTQHRLDTVSDTVYIYIHIQRIYDKI